MFNAAPRPIISRPWVVVRRNRPDAPELDLRHRIRCAVDAGDVAAARQLLASSRFAPLLQAAPATPAHPAAPDAALAGGSEQQRGGSSAGAAGASAWDGHAAGGPASNGLFTPGHGGEGGAALTSLQRQVRVRLLRQPAAAPVERVRGNVGGHVV